MTEKKIDLSWFEKKAESCNLLANLLHIIDNYNKGNINDEELTFVVDIYKKEEFPLPSNRSGNLIALALEMNDFKLASKFLQIDSLSKNKVIFETDKEPGISIYEWLDVYKKNNPTSNTNFLKQILNLKETEEFV